MAVRLEEWIGRLREEYLSDFVAAGGAAVKIVVAAPQDADRVASAVETAAREHAYFVAHVDAGNTRLHMIQDIFHEVARQVDWDGDVERYLRRVFRESGIHTDGVSSVRDVSRIALENNMQREDLLRKAVQLIPNRVRSNTALPKQFQKAIEALCYGTIDPWDITPTDAEMIKLWLTGQKCSLAVLKRLHIYQRIGRHNARLLLASLARWLHEVGHAGLALVVDINAVVADPPLCHSQVRYRRDALLDTYEVIRQFIDDTDEMSHLLIVVVAGPGLLDGRPDPPKERRRSLYNYEALRMRLVDDVHDREYRNPLNVMVQVDAITPGGGAQCERTP